MEFDVIIKSGYIRHQINLKNLKEEDFRTQIRAIKEEDNKKINKRRNK